MSISYKNSVQLNVLKKELKRREGADSSYSARKFAEDSGVDPSTMNKYFNEKRKLTDEAFNIIIRKLRVDEEILDLYEKNIQEYTLLGEKHHKIKSHWYYHGILEAILLYDFEPSVEWIAKRLGLSIETTEEAIADLVSTGVLKIQDGKFINTIGNTTFIEDLNMDELAGRNYQQELLKLAEASIEENSGNLKDHTSLCVAFDSTLIFEIKKKIDTFRSELDDFIQSNSRQYDEVYSLQVNFNSVTSSNSSESES